MPPQPAFVGVLLDVRAQAFRGEFAVFSPLPGCFEHFGLDFMVDEDFHVWLLEANPGPDFKQVRPPLPVPVE